MEKLLKKLLHPARFETNSLPVKGPFAAGGGY
jgi:hypothetical protein